MRMRHTFGWDLPPGVSNYDIERAQMPGCMGEHGDHDECGDCIYIKECKREKSLGEMEGPEECEDE